MAPRFASAFGFSKTEYRQENLGSYHVRKMEMPLWCKDSGLGTGEWLPSTDFVLRRFTGKVFLGSWKWLAEIQPKVGKPVEPVR